MNAALILFFIVFVTQISYMMSEDDIQKEKDVCTTIQSVSTLEDDKKNELCKAVRNLSLSSKIKLLYPVNTSLDLSSTQKLTLFQEVIKQDSLIKPIWDSSGLEFEEKKRLEGIISEKIKERIAEEEKIGSINNAIRTITSVDDSYFNRGRAGYEKRFPVEIQKTLKRYFNSCTILTKPLIDEEKINLIYPIYGFTHPFDHVGFYTLAEKIKSNINRIDWLIDSIKTNKEVKVRKEIKEDKEIEIEEEIFFVIDDKLVNKFIKLFLADCFSRATPLEGGTEEQNKRNFLSYFNQQQHHSFDEVKHFVIEPGIDGGFRAVPLSIIEERPRDEINKKIENFKKLTQKFFRIITPDEKEQWKNFFTLGLTSFKTICAGNDGKLQQIDQFKQIIQEVTVEPPQPMSFKTKFAIAVLLSGSLIFTAAVWLKRNQHKFEQYPFLATLFPFLYQQPVQKPSLLQRLFGK